LTQSFFKPNLKEDAKIISIMARKNALHFQPPQKRMSDTVHWRRFGRSISDKLEVGISTQWIAGSKPVSFALEDFQNALEQFTQLSKTKPDNHCDDPLSPQ